MPGHELRFHAGRVTRMRPGPRTMSDRVMTGLICLVVSGERCEQVILHAGGQSGRRPAGGDGRSCVVSACRPVEEAHDSGPPSSSWRRLEVASAPIAHLHP